MFIDWFIVLLGIMVLLFTAWYTKRYTRSVSDFLAANRCGGRYLISIAAGMAGTGLVNVLAVNEWFYQSGLASNWWPSLMSVVTIVIVVSGWVTYRYRETRALTMAQFFEVRYSKKFRLFTGMISWLSGLLNYGIFPIITARFIVYFMDMPLKLSIIGFDVPTYAVVMAVVLAIAVYLTISGGQISLIVTNFLQGSFTNVVFCLLAIFMITKFSWSDIIEGQSYASENQSMINPFKIGSRTDFNVLFYIAWALVSAYSHMAWQGWQGFNSSAKTPHEAKMANIIGSWRMVLLWTMLLIFSVVAYSVMHIPKYAAMSEPIRESLSQISDPQIQSQLRVSIVLKHLLPSGLIGLLCAVMIAMAITTDDTNLHSWSSIFVQDVVLPFRKTPLSTKQHLKFLRLTVIATAIFAFIFGLLFPLKDYLMMYMTITGSIYVGGAGIAIIGGLYWKRGTVFGAWTGMITGVFLAISGIVVQNIIWPYGLPFLKKTYLNVVWLQQLPEKFPINGMVMSALFALIASASYILVSLMSRKPVFNMNRMLHRGQYAIESEHVFSEPVRGWRTIFNFGSREFTKGDKFICYFTVGLTLLDVFIFIAGTILASTVEISDKAWTRYWLCRLIANFIIGFIAVFWFLIGGIKDFREMFRMLKVAKRDEYDDGTVIDGQNVTDKKINKQEIKT